MPRLAAVTEVGVPLERRNVKLLGSAHQPAQLRAREESEQRQRDDVRKAFADRRDLTFGLGELGLDREPDEAHALVKRDGDIAAVGNL